MIGEMKSYLVGRDPSTIEHHAQALQRHSHFMGALVGGAISAIDIALWTSRPGATACRSTS